jgi:nicotinamide-nucleotide amidase
VTGATDDPVERIAAAADERGLRIAVAESLTGGHLSARLAAGPEASTWFRGGVVAYSAEVKREVLGVGDVPVVSDECARSLAHGACDLLGADAAVAVTGVGGPDPQDGLDPGTVWWAVRAPAGTTVGCEHLDGDPEEVIEATVQLAVERLAEAVGR